MISFCRSYSKSVGITALLPSTRHSLRQRHRLVVCPTAPSAEGHLRDTD